MARLSLYAGGVLAHSTDFELGVLMVPYRLQRKIRDAAPVADDHFISQSSESLRATALSNGNTSAEAALPPKGNRCAKTY